MLMASPDAEQVRLWQAHSPILGWVIRKRLHICNNCVQLGNEILSGLGVPPPSYPPDFTNNNMPGCSFCGTTALRGRHLLAGLEAYICDLCVGLATKTGS